MSELNLIVSSENHNLVTYMKNKFNANIFYQEFVPGHGESNSEMKSNYSNLLSINSAIPKGSKIMYARSYSAFSKKGWNYIKESLKGNEVSISTESIINSLTKIKAHKVFLISPYNQKRHDYEIKWLAGFHFDTIGSIALGRIGGKEITEVTKQTILDSIKIGEKSSADAIYVACTLLPVMEPKEIESQIPVIIPVNSMAKELGLEI